MRRYLRVLTVVVGAGLVVGLWTAASQETSSSEPYKSEGHRLFTQACAPCHQPDGRGVAGVYPPLTPHLGRYVRVPEGRAYLIRVTLFGLMGRLESDGRVYNNIMLPIGLSLTDQQVADILNFVLREINRESLPETFKDISPDEVAQQRKNSRGLSEGLKERDLLLKKLKESDEKGEGRKS